MGWGSAISGWPPSWRRIKWRISPNRSAVEIGGWRRSDSTEAGSRNPVLIRDRQVVRLVHEVVVVVQRTRRPRVVVVFAIQLCLSQAHGRPFLLVFNVGFPSLLRQPFHLLSLPQTPLPGCFWFPNHGRNIGDFFTSFWGGSGFCRRRDFDVLRDRVFGCFTARQNWSRRSKHVVVALVENSGMNKTAGGAPSTLALAVESTHRLRFQPLFSSFFVLVAEFAFFQLFTALFSVIHILTFLLLLLSSCLSLILLLFSGFWFWFFRQGFDGAIFDLALLFFWLFGLVIQQNMLVFDRKSSASASTTDWLARIAIFQAVLRIVVSRDFWQWVCIRLHRVGVVHFVSRKQFGQRRCPNDRCHL